MKFKKLLISASAIAAGSGLLATVLTSCAKANIDAKLRVELDDAGKLYNPGNMEGTDYTFTWKEAIKAALNKSSNWAQFKNALADEIVYSWYVDRASTSKSTDDKNATFRSNLDEWNYNIDNDYKNVIQNCKNKYGANWEFYLQNEYLAPNGGTEAAYKKNKLVEKVKTDFISKVFAKNYFGYRTQENNHAIFPHSYTPASKDVHFHQLRNPKNWGKIGFYARTDLTFPTDMPATVQDINIKQIAKHPEGDYAAIQDYVFDRWFKTEKPFYSAAALFKYSMPAYSATKLDEIYNARRSKVKLPDKPNEAFPFFGAGTDGSTRKAKDFLAKLAAGDYATKYIDGTEQLSNGTVTIDLDQTDDTQTLLVVTGSTMFGALYMPYAMAAGSLYDQMMGGAARNYNTLDKSEVTANINKYSGVLDDFAILSNFFYKTKPSTVNQNVLDLNDVYGNAIDKQADTEYHCPLFLENKEYNHFYGDTTQTGAAASGVRYITNNIQVNNFTYSSVSADAGQPWVMELNESGMHIQTIDGYNYIKNGIDGDKGTSESERLARQKKVLMYRLLQKQVNDDAAKCISSDAILGENGKIKTYFTENFANIIIELALKADEATHEHQVFRSLESYKKATVETSDYFLNKIFTTEKLGDLQKYDAFTNYFTAVLAYETTKKELTGLESANSKILAYRSKQISNTKSSEKFSKTLFENGLLAPFVYIPTVRETADKSQIIETRDYSAVNRIVVKGMNSSYLTTPYTNVMNDLLKAVTESTYVDSAITTLQTNVDNGFSPQIKTAKAKMSNRFWFGSRIVDKAVHTVMGSKAFTANQIKMNAYKYYTNKLDGAQTWLGTDGEGGRIFGDITKSASNQAFLTTYARSKVLTGDKNLSTYVSDLSGMNLAKFYSTMNTQFDKYLDRSKLDNGETCDDALNYQLLKATIMYLLSLDNNVPTFKNFYTLLNSKISEDELAFTGYMARGYSDSSMGTVLDNTEIQTVGSSTTLSYQFDPAVDNEFDRFGYSGKGSGTKTDGVKISSANYWTAINKQFNSNSDSIKAMNGFLGLQTKSNNQLDSGSKLQSTVFDHFAAATKETYDLSKTTPTKNTQDTGCWFKFAGTKDNNGNDLTWKDFTYDDGSSYKTCNADEWFPLTGQNAVYAPVRKIAKKIIERDHEDDLRALAQQLGSCYVGYSYFSEIGSGTVPFPGGINQMKMTMLKLLPSVPAAAHKGEQGSGFEKSHEINTFQRLVNVEAHTNSVTPSRVFYDTSARTSYKLLLTQINKADIVERTLAPEWDDTNKVWKQGEKSPITPEEFWVLFFNLASESTVQQRVVTEVVKAAFGEKKLIVYDAQLYNQFDSIWIKDWTKKTIGA